MTLFGKSNFTRNSGFENDWETVTRLRKREDAAYAARIGVELSYLNLPEAAIRIAATAEAIFPKIRSQSRVVIPGTVRLRANKLLERLRPMCLFAPLAIGGHRDHLIARQFAVSQSRILKLPLFYYEDLPYAAYVSRRALLAQIRSVDPGLRPRSIPIDLSAKLNNLTLYRSQVGGAELQIIAEYALRSSKDQPAERVWSASPDELLGVLRSRAL